MVNYSPEQLSFILPQDRVPLLLALSLYDPTRREIAPFKSTESNIRVASWESDTQQIIGLRGTYIGAMYDHLDEQVTLFASAPRIQ